MLTNKQKFPVENFILSQKIFVLVGKTKHQVAVCWLLFCRAGLTVTLGSTELVPLRFHNT